MLQSSRQFALLLVLSLSLAACGFHLRGPQAMAFKTIHLGMSEYSDLANDLRRQLRTTGTTEAVSTASDAEVRMIVVADNREKNILSLSSGGTVREFQLKRQFRFRVLDKAGREVMSLAEIAVTRDITYNDNIALAKEQEELILQRDMQADLVQQIMRRLAAIRIDPNAPAPAASAPTAAPAAR
ncbi:LPS assembly lipoprotein LptE [Viridibacterium curvum]|uniref:LPS-assembly lipoprotein LptE n=1 Tax=Viridibacterium curvum TaxID=1101404 RepID=A0ABP9Q642_9RHOO